MRRAPSAGTLACADDAGIGFVAQPTLNSSDDINSNGGTDWGEFYPAPVLTRLAVAADTNTLAKLSLTPLTHLVARYAAGFPQGLGWIEHCGGQLTTDHLLALDTDISALHRFGNAQAAPKWRNSGSMELCFVECCLCPLWLPMAQLRPRWVNG